MSNKPWHQPQEERRSSLPIIVLMVVFFFLFCCILIWGISPINKEGSISSPIHAPTQAFYDIEDNRLIPHISKDIIRDVILDNNPYATAEIMQRMADLNAKLLTPVPSMTLSLKNQLLATSLSLTEMPVTSTPFPEATGSLELSPPPIPTVAAIVIPIDLPTALVPVFLPTSTPIPNQPQPGIKIIKKLASYEDNDSSNSITFGDYLWYEFKVSNIGDTLLSRVYVEEISFAFSVICPESKLPVGKSMVCTTDNFHRVTAQEANVGEVMNKAFASGDYDGVHYKDMDKLSLPIQQNPDIQINKSLRSYDDNDSSGGITQGDGLWYQFDVANVGDVTLTNIGVTDNTFAIPVICPSTKLAPLMNMICLANLIHMVTPVETQAGQVVNAATASGDFNGTTYTDRDTLTTTVLPINLFSDISGQVRDDVDGDGDFSDADAGINNVIVELYDGACTLGGDCRSTQTGFDGIFTFTSVPAGDYILVERDLAQYISTADSFPPNDNRIPVIVMNGVGSSNNIFLDRADPATCSDPDPVSGFVIGSNPADGATGHPINVGDLAVFFNTPMLTSGAGSVLDLSNFRREIENLTYGGAVPILGMLYDDATNTAYLTIDTSDPQWQRGSEYRMQVKSVIRNACGVKQNVDVDITFTTEP